MRREKSCGFLLFQARPRRAFLVLHAGARLDLPKGRMKAGEDELACALRELEEEAGVSAARVRVVEGFRYETTYRVTKGSGAVKEKTVVLFAAETEGPTAVVTPDHDDYAWVDWRPPHDYREHPTLHGALTAWATYVAATSGRPARQGPR